MIVTLNLSPEATQQLLAKAAREGQTLEVFLGQLAEHEAAATAEDAGQVRDLEDDDSPWRGVCVLRRPRRSLFPDSVTLSVDELPRRRRLPNLNWLRPDVADE
jgi:hypothetical protein